MNKHYIRIDNQNRIIAGLTDDAIAYPDGALQTDIFIHESGRLFELNVNGEWLTNPPLMEDGVPLYKWDGKAAQKRTDREIEADRPIIEVQEFVEPLSTDEIEFVRGLIETSGCSMDSDFREAGRAIGMTLALENTSMKLERR